MKYYSKITNAALSVWWFSTICPRIPSCCGNNLPTAFLFLPPSVVQEHGPSSSSSSFLRTKTFLTTNSLTTTTTSGRTSCNPYQIRNNGSIRSTRLYRRRCGTSSGAGSGKSKDKQPSRRISKSNLPEKICVVCNRPFTWRKKWERCWDEVTCCSKSCNAKRRGNAASKDLGST